jgi:hypothetical protein
MSNGWKRKNMAKLKNSFTVKTTSKLPVIGTDRSSSGSVSNTAVPRDPAARILTQASSGSVVQALNFGTLHTKATGTTSQSGSQWMSILNSAAGGIVSALGGGLFASGGLGFVGKLLSLFGGSKTTPAAPTPFVSPLSQQNSLNITAPGAASSVSLGVHSLSPTVPGAGIYQQIGSTLLDHNAQSTQVVQIVKQALLTSSSLNDVINEI